MGRKNTGLIRRTLPLLSHANAELTAGLLGALRMCRAHTPGPTRGVGEDMCRSSGKPETGTPTLPARCRRQRGNSRFTDHQIGARRVFAGAMGGALAINAPDVMTALGWGAALS
jgi:hypothetical protein